MKAKGKRKLDEAKLNILTEGGEFSAMNASKTWKSKSTRRSIASTKTKERLDYLLEGPSPTKPILKTPQTDQRDGNTPLTIKHNGFRWATNYLSDANSETTDVAETRSEPASEIDNPAYERYRRRPRTELRPEHFKINPAYNQGLDYAFEEVVRNRDQRKCFPGCTRPECCGDKFRKIVEIGGMPQFPRKGVQWDSSVDDEEQQLLESYLGDDGEQLDLITADEKRKVLIQARAKQLADKFGRHRQAYERRRTPPGFWRTDMPTTQELASDRDAAERVESEKVEEMYREAMRPGGKYLFRDE